MRPADPDETTIELSPPQMVTVSLEGYDDKVISAGRFERTAYMHQAWRDMIAELAAEDIDPDEWLAATTEPEDERLARLKAEAITQLDQWSADKAAAGIEVAEGVFLPASSDDAAKLQLRLGAISSKAGPYTFYDRDKNPWTVETLQEVGAAAAVYDAVWFGRDAAYAAARNLVNQAESPKAIETALAALSEVQ